MCVSDFIACFKQAFLEPDILDFESRLERLERCRRQQFQNLVTLRNRRCAPAYCGPLASRSLQLPEDIDALTPARTRLSKAIAQRLATLVVCEAIRARAQERVTIELDLKPEQ